MKTYLKFLIIGILANIIENIVLLYFFGINFNKQVIIGSIVFGLSLYLLNKLVEKNLHEKEK